MSFQVRVQPSGRTFSTEPADTILDAALRQGITLPHGCRDGACGACKGKVLAGSVTHDPYNDKALTEAERAQGLALFCRAHAQTDVDIECREVAAEGMSPVRKMPARIVSIERAAPDVVVLHLQLPPAETLLFRAGQYLDIVLRDGARRSYSIASAPHAGGPIELHVRHMPGGKFTDALFGASTPAVKERDIVRIEAPLGSFFLRDDSAKPVVLLASGTGFAPIQSMLGHVLGAKPARRFVVYWGCRVRSDLYRHEAALALVTQARAAALDVTYVPVLSESRVPDAWAGRTGLVHQAVMADLPDLSGWQVYACGAPMMVDAAQCDFTVRCGLPPEEFFADAFLSQADKRPV